LTTADDSRPVVLGIDVGSSSAKAVAVDQNGEVLAEASHPYTVTRPTPGRAEVDADDWHRAAEAVIQGCLAQLGQSKVVGLAVDGPAHNVALLNDEGAVLAPVLHWSDLRSKPQADRLDRESGEMIERLSLHPSNPSWTLAQLAWIREEWPEIFAATSSIQVTKDFVRYRLTGEITTDPYDAVGTQLYDSLRVEWSDELCALVGLSASDMSRVIEAHEQAGEILPAAAASTGLAVGTPVFTGSGDTTAEAIGVGMSEIGETVIKLATSGTVLTLAEKPEPDPTLLTYPYVVPPLWIAMASTNAGASSMKWFQTTFLQAIGGSDSVESVGELAAQSPPGADGVLFHPFLSGERSPYWDPNLRAAFTGVSASTSLGDMARAVMEGVALSLRDGASALERTGHVLRSCRLIGGGARSDEWTQIMADVFAKPLDRTTIAASAYGTALIAGVGLGWFDWRDTPEATDSHRRVFEPNAGNTERYDEMFDRYREMVPSLSTDRDVL